MTGSLFAGSGTLTRFVLRRDRLRLSIWIVAICGFCAGFVPIFENLFSNGSEKIVLVEMMKNPAMIAIVGPVYGAADYHTGAMYGNFMLLFSAMIVGVMNVFLISRHTRQDEERGRLEVIRSLPVGRLSNLAAALITAVLANVLISLGTGLLMYALRGDGMDLTGCMMFGVCIGVIGIFFAAVTALFCQMTANTRTANGLSMMLMLVLYMMRAIGDLGYEGLSLASPLGLILRTENFVNNYWRPVWIVLLISAVLIAVAFGLARMRDLGRGLIPERPGRVHASKMLSTPMGLALKLMRTAIIVWLITIFTFAAMYGSIFGDMESFIGNNEMLAAIFMAVGDISLTEQFISMLVIIMSLCATLPVLSFVHRISSEETRGRAEHILARSVSRTSQMAAYFVPAFVMTIVCQILAALGFWSVGRMVLDTIPSLATFMAASLSYLPAMWVMMGISMALVAYLPGKTFISYIYLGYAFIVMYLGTLANLPQWTQKLTPLGYISRYPVEEFKIAPLIVLTLVAAALVVLSFVGYNRRDTKTQ